MIDCTVRNNIGGEIGGVMVTAGAGLTVSDSTICANTPENDISGDWTDDGGNIIEKQCAVACPGDINGDGELELSEWLSAARDPNVLGLKSEVRHMIVCSCAALQ